MVIGELDSSVDNFSLSDIRLFEFNYCFALDNASVVYNNSRVANLKVHHELSRGESKDVPYLI